MEKYEENYQKLSEERKELEEKLLQKQIFQSQKEEEKIKIEQILDNLTEELDELKEEEKKLLNTKKMATILAAISVLLMTTVGIIFGGYFLGKFIETATSKQIGLYLLTIIFGTPTAMLVTFIPSLKISKKIVQKQKQKIKNSDKYKELSQKIIQKEKELIDTRKNRDKVSEECLEALLESARLSAAVKLKKETITLLQKNNTTSTLDEGSIIETKPHARIKTKYSN